MVHVNIFYLKFTKHATMMQPESIIAARSNSKMAEMHAAECSKVAYLGVN